MLTNEYAAGLFDGEGSAKIDWNRNKNRFRYKLSVVNTNRPVLAALEQTYGGGVYLRTRHTGEKPCWVWEIGGDDGRCFADKIYPCLIVRRKDVWLAKSLPRGRGNRRLTMNPLTKVAQAVAFITLRLVNGRHNTPELEQVMAAHAALERKA